MEKTFYYVGRQATSVTLNLSGWNTSNVTTMLQMFEDAGRYATSWSISDISN